MQKMKKRSLSRQTGRGEGWAGSYVASGEGEHGEEDDGQFGFRYFGTNSSEDGHDGARLQTETGTSGCLFIENIYRRPPKKIAQKNHISVFALTS